MRSRVRRRVCSDEDRARIEELVEDLGRVIILDNGLPLPADLSRDEIEATDGARLAVIRAANAVSAAAVAFDRSSIDEARAAVADARNAVRASLTVMRRHQPRPPIRSAAERPADSTA